MKAYAWRIRIYGRDLFPLNIKILRAARHAVAWMPVCHCRSVGVSDIRVSMGLADRSWVQKRFFHGFRRRIYKARLPSISFLICSGSFLLKEGEDCGAIRKKA